MLPQSESHISFFIEMDLKEIGLDCMGRIFLAQNRGQGQAVVNLGMDLCFP
jgi:hypothetical protein